MIHDIRPLAGIVLLALIPFATVQAAEPPAQVRDWLGPQTWIKDTDGPIVQLGENGDFDDMHIFAPAVAEENGVFSLWYCGSRGTRSTRVFRLGLATGRNGKVFEKHPGNPVLEFKDASHSVLTPALLRNPDGTTLRENGKLRMWFSSTEFGKTGLHTLHESSSPDGVSWAEPSQALLEHVYCPTVIKTGDGFQMWYADVSRRPWLIRHASSTDGTQWQVTERPVLQMSQSWEAEILVYPTVVKIDDAYLMWYGSYHTAVRRQTTAIGFAVSRDGLTWFKHPQNPVIRPDPERAWESNYVGSGCVMRLADGSFRYWYASRKKPPFENLYFAINTARWNGPAGGQPAPDIPRRESKPAAPAASRTPRLPMPPQQGSTGTLASLHDAEETRIDVLEVVDQANAVLRAWYVSSSGHSAGARRELTFVDLWVHGIDTRLLAAGTPAKLSHTFRVAGNKLFDTDCGRRSLPLLEVSSE